MCTHFAHRNLPTSAQLHIHHRKFKLHQPPFQNTSIKLQPRYSVVRLVSLLNRAHPIVSIPDKIWIEKGRAPRRELLYFL